MAWINVTTNDGELIERYDTREWDLGLLLGWESLIECIQEATDRAERIESAR